MKQRILMMTFGVLLISGILLAASDGALFPWPNITGLLLTASAALMVPALNSREEAADRSCSAPRLRMVSSNAPRSLNFQKDANSRNKAALSEMPKDTAADRASPGTRRAV